MHAELINPFIQTINHILHTMAATSCAHGAPFVKRDSAPLGDVTAIIPMQGAGVAGSVAISFSASTIIGITTAMLGEEVLELDESCTSLTGELTNMLSGGARQLLEQRGYDIDMARPNLLQGSEPICHHGSSPVIVIPFDSQHGDFFIELTMTIQQ